MEPRDSSKPEPWGFQMPNPAQVHRRGNCTQGCFDGLLLLL